MIKRFFRGLVGVLWVLTLVFTIIPNLIVWIITGKDYIIQLAEWIFLDDDEK
jgi:hypothetical protein